MISEIRSIVESPWFPSIGGFVEFCVSFACLYVVFFVIKYLIARRILLSFFVVAASISLIAVAIASPPSSAISLPTLLVIIYAVRLDAKRKERERKKREDDWRKSIEHINSFKMH